MQYDFIFAYLRLSRDDKEKMEESTALSLQLGIKKERTSHIDSSPIASIHLRYLPIHRLTCFFFPGTSVSLPHYLIWE